MPGKQSSLGKIFYRIVQGVGKGFDERAAARRTCLIELYAVYGLVLNLDAFHVLAAYIQDAVNLRVKKGCGIIVGHCFHFALIQHEGRFQQCLPIAGGAGVNDTRPLRQQLMDFFQRKCCRRQGVAVVAAIKGIQQGAVFADERDFRGRRTRVDAQKAVPLVRRKVFGQDMVFPMAFAEFIVICPICEQRFHPFHFKFHFDIGRELLKDALKLYRHIWLMVQRRADGREQV